MLGCVDGDGFLIDRDGLAGVIELKRNYSADTDVWKGAAKRRKEGDRDLTVQYFIKISGLLECRGRDYRSGTL